MAGEARHAQPRVIEYIYQFLPLPSVALLNRIPICGTCGDCQIIPPVVMYDQALERLS